MRSRNGNRPLLLTGIALISTLCSAAEYYYIGYRLTTQNARPIAENLSVSKAMIPCSARGRIPLLLERDPDEPLEHLLRRENDTFLTYAMRQNAHIQSNARIKPAQTDTLETLTFPARCYAVDINGEFVTITALQ